MTHVTVTLKIKEREALVELARRERRDPRDQAALIVVRELERAGLLPAAPAAPLVESQELAHAGAD
jgi:hypothetical protein